MLPAQICGNKNCEYWKCIKCDITLIYSEENKILIPFKEYNYTCIK